MKTFSSILIIVTTLLASCGSDDSRSCTTCTSDQTIPFTICEESNGNASINGENTGVVYATYIDGLITAGATCGE
ncbi:hypothetical protein ULMA_07310 [Patiriisocius marinus]|uniref:Uncharacterized protein n=1 Tax=Patiriisocius marinus TaxID=1397112 RepID=A0A5J4IYR8_9FLAO|nr:hypothetical protein [Patiriisocius marinus]GER58623.1 hypothetical protein ULMA_07310 [Patiriisocius marinus]